MRGRSAQRERTSQAAAIGAAREGFERDRSARTFERALGAIPSLVGADALLGAKRKPDADVLETEILVDRERQAIEGGDFRFDLLRSAEDVPVVLGEGAHAHDAVQRSRSLVAVAETELAVTQRQIAIAAQVGRASCRERVSVVV